MKKTSWGPGQIFNHTPAWVKISIAVLMSLLFIINYIIFSDPILTADFKVRAGIYLNAGNMAVFFLGQMFGVKTHAPDETEEITERISSN